MTDKGKYCVLIPGYREEGRIGAVVKDVLKHGAEVLVVDDGSPDATATEAEAAGAIVLKHEVNKGKGVALETGFKYAQDHGYEFVITMDADGQHDPADLGGLIKAHKEGGFPVVVGSRMWDTDKMPFVRRMTNRFMSWLLSREMGQRVPDTQSGYRLYARDVLGMLKVDSARFAAESEVLLALADEGVKIGSAPIQVIYGDEKSKINPLSDTLKFFSMLREYRRKRRGCGGRGENPETSSGL
jgi:glycosyltransferase involved in cell wall biosynthesis